MAGRDQPNHRGGLVFGFKVEHGLDVRHARVLLPLAVLLFASTTTSRPGLMYAFSEGSASSLSHDEVVDGRYALQTDAGDHGSGSPTCRRCTASSWPTRTSSWRPARPGARAGHQRSLDGPPPAAGARGGAGTRARPEPRLPARARRWGGRRLPGRLRAASGDAEANAPVLDVTAQAVARRLRLDFSPSRRTQPRRPARYDAGLSRSTPTMPLRRHGRHESRRRHG